MPALDLEEDCLPAMPAVLRPDEGLEEAVSGKSPRFDRPLLGMGSAMLGSADPESGGRTTGGNPGISTEAERRGRIAGGLE